MADDIVTRLREAENLLRLSEVRSINAVDVLRLSSDTHDAADEIERLRAEIRRLQGTLGDVLGERDHWKWSATGNE